MEIYKISYEVNIPSDFSQEYIARNATNLKNVTNMQIVKQEDNKNKIYFLTTEDIYNKIMSDGEYILPTPKDDYYNSEGLQWLKEQYKTRLGLDEPVYDLECQMQNLEYLESWCMADHISALIELEIPENNFMILQDTVYSFLQSNSYIAKDEEEWDALNEQNDPDLSLHKENWLRIFDPEFNWEESWHNPIFLKHFHKVKKEWVKNVKFFRGQHWAKWIGPDKVNPENYPTLKGYGDDLKIGDKFIEGNPDRVMVLYGWDVDDRLVYVYFKEEAEDGYCSMALNTCGGDRVLTKVFE
jgi:hypothetical protein